jgi:uncharacterized protein (DUF1697 family)
MRYVALLRGVNVGGANMVSMADLKAAFEAAGMDRVRSYINSGNIIFGSGAPDREGLTATLQAAVRTVGGLDIDLQLRSEDELAVVVEAIPAGWVSDGAMRCDVVFLQPDVDRRSLLEELGPRPGIEDGLYVPGAIVWRVDRENATRSRLTKMMGTKLYKRVTVRNCNTARKLLQLMRE